ncbi:MAG TPA: GIY-YIG nuclease family protein [bacterium]|nr:GIY-YIG nuclease family protein [bacterium]
MNIIELLEMRGLNVNDRIKMLRHQVSGHDLHDIYKQNRSHFEVYQSTQGKTRLNCNYIVSFIGLPHGHAVFIGVYKIEGAKPMSEAKPPLNYPYIKLIERARTWYDMVRCDGYEDLIDRVVIDWGQSERSWHQWLKPDKPKEIVEILPAGFVKYFPGFLEISLDYADLKTMIRNPVANREWHILLKSVAGVYLIVDRKTGKQYVGAAYGADGILGRWRSYAETGHGGNKQLIEKVNSSDDYPDSFTFSILHTLPKSSTKDEALEWERLFKNKLGMRAFGLNTN